MGDMNDSVWGAIKEGVEKTVKLKPKEGTAPHTPIAKEIVKDNLEPFGVDPYSKEKEEQFKEQEYELVTEEKPKEASRGVDNEPLARRTKEEIAKEQEKGVDNEPLARRSKEEMSKEQERGVDNEPLARRSKEEMSKGRDEVAKEDESLKTAGRRRSKGEVENDRGDGKGVLDTEPMARQPKTTGIEGRRRSKGEVENDRGDGKGVLDTEPTARQPKATGIEGKRRSKGEVENDRGDGKGVLDTEPTARQPKASKNSDVINLDGMGKDESLSEMLKGMETAKVSIGKGNPIQIGPTVGKDASQILGEKMGKASFGVGEAKKFLNDVVKEIGNEVKNKEMGAVAKNGAR